jgi:serine/threonine protein kinase
MSTAAADSSSQKKRDALTARLAEALAKQWRQGDCLPVEDFLVLHQLQEQPEIGVPLIYEEMCLRREVGREATVDEYLGRFPQWRRQLEMLFHCHDLFQPVATPFFPEVGESLGDFRLLAELGRGAHGRVFLATQAALADRPVVLKLTPRTGGEHLSLARLQHTNILPLLFVQEDESRHLLMLCMPYFGGATLAQILESSPGRRVQSGRQFLKRVDAVQAASPIPWVVRGPARRFLQRATAVQTVCWVGACLADALHYAHEQELVHLDVKPSNVLVTADGQPMLLDFHLASQPVSHDEPPPLRLGGTPAYMAPEQQAAFAAVGAASEPSTAVDGRADIYALGLVLHEMLGGPVPPPAGKPVPPSRVNREVPTGLADILAKCLSVSPQERYATAADLAADLRRQLADQPLVGVRNRSLLERWRKWRRRRPHSLLLGGLLTAALIATAAATALFALHFDQQHDVADAALVEGHRQFEQQQYAQALATLRRGQAAIQGLPGDEALKRQLAAEVLRAAQALAAQELHQLADRMRFHYGSPLPPAQLRALEGQCRRLWDRRAEIVGKLESSADPLIREQIQNDLLDLAILWTDLSVRLATAKEETAARREALEVLQRAESMFGPSPVLLQERRIHIRALGLPAKADQAALVPRTAWEHYALGRSLLRAGQPAQAAPYFIRAVELQPRGLWPNYYRGVCAHQLGRHQEAVMAFSACIAVAPENAGLWFNRAVALAAQGYGAEALRDYDQALRLDAALAPAALNRGLLHFRDKRYAEAEADLQRALKAGADPAPVHYNLALVRQAQDDRAGAIAHLRRALEADPNYVDARRLLDRLDGSK